jgi:hypothetical protein
MKHDRFSVCGNGDFIQNNSAPSFALDAFGSIGRKSTDRWARCRQHALRCRVMQAASLEASKVTENDALVEQYAVHSPRAHWYPKQTRSRYRSTKDRCCMIRLPRLLHSISPLRRRVRRAFASYHEEHDEIFSALFDLTKTRVARLGFPGRPAE